MSHMRLKTMIAALQEKMWTSWHSGSLANLPDISACNVPRKMHTWCFYLPTLQLTREEKDKT